jgi:3-methyladenine DNA glycosylase AlkC
MTKTELRKQLELNKDIICSIVCGRERCPQSEKIKPDCGCFSDIRTAEEKILDGVLNSKELYVVKPYNVELGGIQSITFQSIAELED